jgi:hypothetical protein
MMRRRSLNDDRTTVPAPRTATPITNPNPPRAQSKLHKFAISGVPMNERVQTIVCSIGDLRLALEADVAWSVRESARGRTL